MTLPTRLTSYPVEQEVLDTFLRLGKPLTYTLPTPGIATKFRQRAYYFRKLKAEAGVLEYERVVIKQKGNILTIDFAAPEGTLTTHDGAILTLSVPLDVAQAEAEAQAKELFTEEFSASLIAELDLND